MKPRNLIFNGTLAAASILTGCGKAPAQVLAPPPNVVLIVADDLGYGDLGSYGQKRIHTPNLDRMAAEGMRFTQAYAGSSVCSPSRCCLLTGLHTGHSFVRGNNPTPPLPEGTRTLGNLMHKAGYATALTGKWDQGEVGTSGEPMRQGFDYFFGYDNMVAAHNYWPAYLWRNSEKVALPNKVRELPTYYSITPGGVAVEKLRYAPDAIADEALKFVEGNREKPFFLMWTSTIPHANNEAADKGMEVPDAGAYTAMDWPEAEKNYAAMVTRLDDEVGRLLDYLKAHRMEHNTLVIFTSDNGPHSEGGYNPKFFESSGGLRGGKRDLYEGGICVPFIVWGGGTDGGKVMDKPVALWDIMATLDALTGGKSDAGDGVPLPLSFEQDVAPSDRVFYWEMHEAPKARAIRVGDWKLIDFFSENRVELYDLRHDSAESHDLAKEQPERVLELRELMEKQRSPSPFWSIKKP